MKSENFEFLRQYNPDLADLGAYAELYVHSDPASSNIKSRIMAEYLAKSLCNKFAIPLCEDNFLGILKELEYKNILPKTILDMFHLVRMEGNAAAHMFGTSKAYATQTLKNVFDLTQWWVRFMYSPTMLPIKFIEIPNDSDSAKKNVEREKQLENVTRQLEEDNKKLRQKLTELSEEKVAQFADRAAGAANALKFDEKTTRKRLIDTMLVMAGWNLDDRDEVWQEQTLELENSPSGKGRSDYVLYDDDGTALAVIEAKRTATDPAVARIEAKNYADALTGSRSQSCAADYNSEQWL